MPRQIIDVESSRPAYVRRRVTTFIVTLVILLALAVGVWLYLSHHTAALAHYAAGVFQETSPAGGTWDRFQ